MRLFPEDKLNVIKVMSFLMRCGPCLSAAAPHPGPASSGAARGHHDLHEPRVVGRRDKDELGLTTMQTDV